MTRINKNIVLMRAIMKIELQQHDIKKVRKDV